MSGPCSAENSIANIDPHKRCYEGASAQGQLHFANGRQGWAQFSSKTCTYIKLGTPATLAMGLTECCAESGRGMVFWMVKADYSTLAKFPWTQTTAALPSLLYVDFVWDDASKNEWLRQPHWARLDRLNARAGALNLDALTMPITFDFEMDNYDNVQISEGLAPISLAYNSSGHTYLGFTADMKSLMRFGDGTREGQYWQAPKDALIQFKMMSGPLVAARLQAMYREARSETLWFLRSLIKEAIKGHDEWVSNGGYTIEGDKDLGPALARKFEAAVRQQRSQDQAGDKLQELRNITSKWDAKQRGTLQKYIDVMNTGVVADLSRFIVFDEGWNNSLSREEKGMAIELWRLEDEDNHHGVDGADEMDDHADAGSNATKPDEVLGGRNLSAGLPSV